MISKTSSIKGSRESIEYIQNDKELGRAIELDRNGILGEKPAEILREFRLMQQCNQKCQKNTISIVISPSDERKFKLSELRAIAREHLKGFGLSENQYLATVHQSTGKPHIHIIANRIGIDGKAVKDNFIGLKSQKISENIAKSLGLKIAKEFKKLNEIALFPIKQEIQKANGEAMKEKNFGLYISSMLEKGIEVKPYLNKNDQLQGFRLFHQSSGKEFKASQAGKGVGMKELIFSGMEMPKMTDNYVKVQAEYRIAQGQKKALELARMKMNLEKEKDQKQEQSIKRGRRR